MSSEGSARRRHTCKPPATPLGYRLIFGKTTPGTHFPHQLHKSPQMSLAFIPLNSRSWRKHTIISYSLPDCETFSIYAVLLLDPQSFNLQILMMLTVQIRRGLRRQLAVTCTKQIRLVVRENPHMWPSRGGWVLVHLISDSGSPGKAMRRRRGGGTTVTPLASGWSPVAPYAANI